MGRISGKYLLGPDWITSSLLQKHCPVGAKDCDWTTGSGVRLCKQGLWLAARVRVGIKIGMWGMEAGQFSEMNCVIRRRG